MTPLLLDTQAFLLAIFEPSRLPRRVRSLLNDVDAVRSVSVVTLWEIATKTQIGKLNTPPDKRFYERHVGLLNARTLAVELEHVEALFDLPLIHKDPFDRMLIAQARCEGLTLVSGDRVFAGYGIDVIW